MNGSKELREIGRSIERIGLAFQLLKNDEHFEDDSTIENLKRLIVKLETLKAGK